VSSKQIDAHQKADQPAAGKVDKTGDILLVETRKEGRGEKDFEFNFGNTRTEVFVDDDPDIFIHLRQGARQDDKDGHRKQGHGQFQRSQRGQELHKCLIEVN